MENDYLCFSSYCYDIMEVGALGGLYKSMLLFLFKLFTETYEVLVQNIHELLLADACVFVKFCVESRYRTSNK